MRLLTLVAAIPSASFAAAVEVSCISPVSESIQWWEAQVDNAEKECARTNDRACTTLSVSKTALEQCRLPSTQWGQKYVFRMDLSPSQAPTPALVDVFFAPCRPPGPLKQRNKPAQMTGSLGELFLDMSTPGLSAQMVFRIDRTTLEGGFDGKRNYTCTVNEMKTKNKI